ncbi:MAG: hypothetical protein LCH74_09975 [Proteobacteria bacterium]|nr:hypothetical protein [Pseudomonadota bacterium]
MQKARCQDQKIKIAILCDRTRSFGKRAFIKDIDRYRRDHIVMGRDPVPACSIYAAVFSGRAKRINKGSADTAAAPDDEGALAFQRVLPRSPTMRLKTARNVHSSFPRPAQRGKPRTGLGSLKLRLCRHPDCICRGLNADRAEHSRVVHLYPPFAERECGRDLLARLSACPQLHDLALTRQERIDLQTGRIFRPPTASPLSSASANRGNIQASLQ